jgi:hypothetical protein
LLPRTRVIHEQSQRQRRAALKKSSDAHVGTKRAPTTSSIEISTRSNAFMVLHDGDDNSESETEQTHNSLGHSIDVFWECPVCSLHNDEHVSYCEACESVRPPEWRTP